jgi:hypothetical protein
LGLRLLIFGSGMFFFFPLFQYGFRLLIPSAGVEEPSVWQAFPWLFAGVGATLFLSYYNYHEKFGSVWLLYGINIFLHVYAMAFLVVGALACGLFSFRTFLLIPLGDEHASVPLLVALVALTLGMCFVARKINRLRLPFEPPGQ